MVCSVFLFSTESLALLKWSILQTFFIHLWCWSLNARCLSLLRTMKAAKAALATLTGLTLPLLPSRRSVPGIEGSRWSASPSGLPSGVKEVWQTWLTHWNRRSSWSWPSRNRTVRESLQLVENVCAWFFISVFREHRRQLPLFSVAFLSAQTWILHTVTSLSLDNLSCCLALDDGFSKSERNTSVRLRLCVKIYWPRCFII